MKHKKLWMTMLITAAMACMMLALLPAVQISPVVFAEDAAADEATVDPSDENAEFSAVIYDSTNGLPTSGANTLVQTDEGFIWIASYGGLIRYDGNDFVRTDAEGGPASTGCLLVDSQGRMWIGTNDNGIARMEQGQFTWWNEQDGLSSDKVRDIAESPDGNIYVGTISGVSIITPEGEVKKLNHRKIKNAYVEQMSMGSDGTLYCVTNEGDYFAVLGEKLVNYIDHTKANIKGIVCLFPDPDDPNRIYIATENSDIFRCKAKGNPSGDPIDISPLAEVNNMRMIDGKLWLCARNGIGIISDDVFRNLSDLKFTSSVTDVMKDYEGNLWFSSSRQGVMKLTPNRFENVFETCNIPPQVVNCTRMYEDQLYVGTEEGLIVIDGDETVSSVPVTEARYASGGSYPASDLINLLEGCRIRSMIKDSKDRLWISTWQSLGLLRFDHGKLTVFDANTGIPSDRVRVVHEMNDGRIVAAITGGVVVIEGDQVTRIYDQDDGIATNESLTVCGAPNGDILAGTNGGGIYIINDQGVRCIDKKDGLLSNVVMRIYYYENRDIFWIVTGNSIAYMTSDYKVTTLDEFPYPDNLDLYENSRGEMWVLSSNGIYIASEDDMIADKKMNYTHYGVANGLSGVVVSNSYSELTDEGVLYMPTNTGVVKVNIDAPGKDYSDIKQAVPYIEGDDEMYYPDEDGTFTIPSNVKKLTIYGYVFNNSLTDPLISCKLEGFDRNEMFFTQSELHPMVYTNLSGGTYKYVMTLKDELGNDSKTLSVKISKQRSWHESVWFYIMAAVALMALMFLLARLYVRRKMQKLEEQHRLDAEKERVNNELQMANRIQMSMLPHEFPPFPDRNEFDIYASSDPARAVGGDFYDYFLIDDDHLCLCIADVSGKGVPAALYMMNVKIALQIIARSGSSVEDLLRRVNNAICENNQLEMFITVWIGYLEISTGKLVAANAGHEYPTIKRADGSFELFKDKHGFVLGGMENMVYHPYELQLQPGDKLFLYTDGIPEATDADLQMFGIDRMLAALNEDADAAPEQLLHNVRDAIDAFVKDAEQFDDLTMLCFEYKGSSAD